MASATMQNDLNMRLQRTAPSGNGSTRTLWSMGKAGAPHTNRGVRSDIPLSHKEVRKEVTLPA